MTIDVQKDSKTSIYPLSSTDSVISGVIETLVHDYSCRSRAAFPLWRFRTPLAEADYAALEGFS